MGPPASPDGAIGKQSPQMECSGPFLKQIKLGTDGLNLVRILKHLVVPGAFQNERHVAAILILCILLQISDKLRYLFRGKLGLAKPNT